MQKRWFYKIPCGDRSSLLPRGAPSHARAAHGLPLVSARAPPRLTAHPPSSCGSGHPPLLTHRFQCPHCHPLVRNVAHRSSRRPRDAVRAAIRRYYRRCRATDGLHRAGRLSLQRQQPQYHDRLQRVAFGGAGLGRVRCGLRVWRNGLGPRSQPDLSMACGDAGCARCGGCMRDCATSGRVPVLQEGPSSAAPTAPPTAAAIAIAACVSAETGASAAQDRRRVRVVEHLLARRDRGGRHCVRLHVHPNAGVRQSLAANSPWLLRHEHRGLQRVPPSGPGPRCCHPAEGRGAASASSAAGLDRDGQPCRGGQSLPEAQR
jgi:hypothetical protein